MIGIAVKIPKIQCILVAIKKSEFNSYMSNENEKSACNSHAHMFHLSKKQLYQKH